MFKTLIIIGGILFVLGLIAANYRDPQVSTMLGANAAGYAPKLYASYGMPLVIIGGALIVIGLAQPKR